MDRTSDFLCFITPNTNAANGPYTTGSYTAGSYTTGPYTTGPVGSYTTGPQTTSPGPTPAASSAFYEAVRVIEKQLSSLKQNIDRLHTLAKYKTLFDDKSRDIDLMTHRIKNTLQDISTKIDELEREGLSGYSDVPLTRDGSSHRQTLVAVLRGQMMEGTREFTAALQTRRRTLEILEARKGIYVKDTSNFDIEAQHDDILEVSAGRRGGMVTTMQTYHQSRSEAVEQLQRLIGEVSTMFSRVAGMVSQQEEMVLRIDATMDDSLIRLREGQEQLLKYFSSIKNHRKLILQLLGMLTCFAMFFIVFLA